MFESSITLISNCHCRSRKPLEIGHFHNDLREPCHNTPFQKTAQERKTPKPLQRKVRGWLTTPNE